MNQFNFVKVATAVPELHVADPNFNVSEMIRLFHEAVAADADIVLFPELSITGYSCADLFMNEALLQGAEKATSQFLTATVGQSALAVIGLPVIVGGRLFNCAALLQNGSLLGVIPKAYLHNYGEFYEQRGFSAAL